jgi:pimeloyl-ACP methyl ester carboxylesterase
MGDDVLLRARAFSAAHASELTVGGLRWRYCRLGRGPVLLWLTGGLRRAALACAVLDALADGLTVVAPDYPPRLRTLEQFEAAMAAILRAVGSGDAAPVHVLGQSYGGLLAQALVARRPDRVDRLVLSSTRPGDRGPGWAVAAGVAAAVIRALPEHTVQLLLSERLERLVQAPSAQAHALRSVVREVVEHDLTRDDLVSHFTVARDIVRRRTITPEAFAPWTGHAVLLRARNDPTQHHGDFQRWQRLFGREPEVVDMGDAGHAAALVDPERYAGWVRSALRG